MTDLFQVIQENSSPGGASSVTLDQATSGPNHALIAVVLSNSATSDKVTASDGTELTALVWTQGHGGDYTGFFIYHDVPAGVTSLSCPGCYAIGYVEASGPARAFANLGIATGGSSSAVQNITLASPAGQAAGTLTLFVAGYPASNGGTPYLTGMTDHLLSTYGQFAWTTDNRSISTPQAAAHTWDGCAVTFSVAGTLGSIPTGAFRLRCGQFATSGMGISYSKFPGMPPVAGEPLSSITAYEAFLGRPVDYVLDYMIEAPTSWAQFEGCFTTPASPITMWGDLGSRKLLLGVPACCGSSIGSGAANWQQEAAGASDANWMELGRTLIAAGYGDAVLRIGREWNGTWYPWAVKSTGPNGVANFIAGWQRIVSVLRSLPGAEFRYMWNPYLGNGGSGIATISSAFPGPEYVDFLGLDVYDGGYATLSKPPYTRDIATREARFAEQETQDAGLASWKTFAAAQGVPLAFPEWGPELWWSNGYPGGGDNPYFISQMANKYVAAAGMHALWEHPGNGVFDPDTAPSRKLNGTLLPVPQSRQAFLGAFAGPPAAPPALPSPAPPASQQPPTGPQYRYYAQALDGTWLHRDLPVTGGSLTWGLNGGDTCSLQISPPAPELYDSGGNLILPAWGCYLYAEEEGQVIWGGILTDPEYTEPTLTLNGIGFSDYAQGFVYDGDPYVKTSVDPLDVVRDLWDYIQTRGVDDPSLPRAVTSNLGLILDGTASPARIGNVKDSSGLVLDVPQGSKDSGVALEQFAATGGDNQLWLVSAKDGQGYSTIRNKNSGLLMGVAGTAQGSAVIQHTASGLDTQKWQVVTNGDFSTIVNKAAGLVLDVKGGSLQARAPVILWPGNNGDNQHWVIGTPDANGYATITSVNTGAVTPYELDWWNSTDLGQEITSLGTQAPFDFAAQCSWADEDKQAVTKRLRLGYPRLGTRRANLRFAEGENIADVVTVTNRGTEYANEVIALGSGSGSAMLRSVAASSDGRLLRRLAWTDQSLTIPEAVMAAARRELTASQGLDEVNSLTVLQHPHAPIGSYTVGDDIPLTLAGPGGQRVIWHRITSYSLDLTGTSVALTTARSDTFAYLPGSG